jgi:monoamine oxidase
MARTPLLSRVQRAAAHAAAESEREGLTRRDALRRAGIAGAAATAGSLLPGGRWLPAANAATAPRIVVVGAGLAGLTAAYRLKQSGYSASVHEASTRVGGRCWSIRGYFAEGQVAEHGGELIDSNHIEIKQLCQELGLSLDNLYQAEQQGTESFNFFSGRSYSETQATNDLKGIWQQIHSDVSAASYPTTYLSSTPRGRELDAMSIYDWIERYVPGGHGSPLGQLLDVAYNIEYGAETTQQSSLNMLYLLGYSGQGNLRIFGPSNEKFHVRGGNDQIASGLAAALAGQITMSSELVALRRDADATYRLTFKQGNKSVDVVADQVVLALPFSILRSSVDISGAQFGDVKRRAIAEQGMGTNSKLNVQFKDRLWRTLGCNGETYADTGYQNTWEVSRAQPGTSGILVDYTGGTIGASFGSGTPQSRAQTFAQQLEPVLPGISSRLNGKATIDYWQGYRWTKGSYSYWKVGQYTGFSGAEGERSFNCHFAGEHTSQDFQGYLQGAVETGERAASEVLADLK